MVTARLRGGWKPGYQALHDYPDTAGKGHDMKFDLGKGWSEAVAMLQGNREVLGIVAGIFFFLPGLLFTLIGPDMNAMFAGFDPDQMEQLMAAFNAVYARYWWLFGLLVLTQIIGYLALLALLRDDARPTVGQAIGTGLKALLPAFVTYLLFVLGVSLALGLLIALFALTGVAALAVVAVIACIPLALYLSIKVSLAAPIIAIEKTFNPITVLLRSWRLTKGNSLRLFAFFVLLTVAYVVISAVLGVVLLALVAALGDETGRIVSGIVSGLVGAVATVVMIAVLAAVHRQLAGPSSGSISETFK